MVSMAFDWNKAFLEKSTDKKASNITSNFILNKIVTIDDRDPPWTNRNIKSIIKNKTEYLKNCVKPNNSHSVRHFEQMQDVL